jgi:hypothetical protein
MSLVTKRATKGSALTHNELDDNFESAWNTVKLTSDYVNATTTPSNITDGSNPFTYTPPANTDFEMEITLIVKAVGTTNMPRVQAVLPGAANNMQYSTVQIAWDTTATGWGIANGGALTGALTVSIPAGTAISATVPFGVTIYVKGRSGSSPAAININGFGESAAADAITVKAGSVMRYRTLA